MWTNDSTVTLYSVGLLLVLLGLAEVLRRVLRWPAEISRKVVHAGTAGLVIAATLSFESAEIPMLLALPFVFVNLVAVPRRWIPSMHDIERQSWGTVTFPIAFLVLALFCWLWAPDHLLAMQVAFAVMGLADPMAALIGERWGRRTYDVGGGAKSWVGTTSFAIVSWLATFAVLTTLSDVSWQERLLLSSIVALVSTVAEMLAGRGWDNLLVACLSAATVVSWQVNESHAERMVAAVVCCAVMALLSLRLRFLCASGALAAALLGFVLLGLGGLQWFVPALVFFVLSSLLSKLGRDRKAQAAAITSKGSRRDAAQVYANGGVAGWLVLLHVLWPNPLLCWGFLGAIAASAADTWGTEWGTYARGATRHVLTGQPVSPGVSGGVSWWGSIGSVLGALSIGVTVLGFDYGAESLFVAVGVVTCAGVLGALADSVAGASMQALYRDATTGEPTERASTERKSNELIRGCDWMDNDRVNLLCTLVGATVAIVLIGHT